MSFHQKSTPKAVKDIETKRRKITQYCLKSSSLEGIELDKDALDQFDLLDSGQITMDDFIANMLKKVSKGNHDKTDKNKAI